MEACTHNQQIVIYIQHAGVALYSVINRIVFILRWPIKSYNTNDDII